MAGKHVETFALKLGKCPKYGSILCSPGNVCYESGWCMEAVF